ncbi:hypothetical protein pipiens_000723, partial [Culex pipiens pipiens]
SVNLSACNFNNSHQQQQRNGHQPIRTIGSDPPVAVPVSAT